jgi:hypothetical protein
MIELDLPNRTEPSGKLRVFQPALHEFGLAPAVDDHSVLESKRGSGMYIGLGTVVLIVVVVLLFMMLRGRRA